MKKKKRIRKARKPVQKFSGSRFVKAGGITIGCMSHDARDLLDRAMSEWKQFKKGFPKGHRATVYGFAYWLIRWSGLVQPATK